MDTGNHEVNVDDAVLSGKVVFQAKDYVLLLMPGMLVCREFATDTKGFTLKLDQITGCYISKNSLNKFEISAVVPRSANDPALVQSIFEIHCHSPEEVEEWVETLQSVITDRNIRAINEKEEEKNQAKKDQENALTELKSMFPNLDEDVLLAVYLATNNNLPQAIDELLEFNDPNHKAISSLPENTNSQNPTSTPQSQIDLDEQLALMLQDQLFMEQLQRDEQLRQNLPQEESDFSLGNKLQEMSDATKRKFAELYHKFKRSGDKSNDFSSGDPLGEEMAVLAKGKGEKKHNGYDTEESEESEDEAPLDRPLTSHIFNTNPYQPLSTSPPKSPSVPKTKTKSKETDNDGEKDFQASLVSNEEL